MSENGLYLNPIVLRFANRIGQIGLGLLVIPALIAALVFRGDEDEHFSFLTHTLSELGRYELSQFALLVNGGLFFGGLCIMVSFATRWYLIRHYRSEALYYLTGMMLALTTASVGLFPINVGQLHISAVVTLQMLTPVCALLHIASIWRNQEPKLFMLPALLAATLAAKAYFDPERDLLLMDRYAYSLFGAERPTFWWAAVESWLLLAAIGVWMLSSLMLFNRHHTAK